MKAHKRTIKYAPNTTLPMNARNFSGKNTIFLTKNIDQCANKHILYNFQTFKSKMSQQKSQNNQFTISNSTNKIDKHANDVSFKSVLCLSFNVEISTELQEYCFKQSLFSWVWKEKKNETQRKHKNANVSHTYLAK